MMYTGVETIPNPWSDPSEGVSPASLLSAGTSTPLSDRRRSSILSTDYDVGFSSSSSATASLPHTPNSENYTFKFGSLRSGNSTCTDPRTPRVCRQDTSAWPSEWYSPPSKGLLRSPFLGSTQGVPTTNAQRSTMSLHTSFDSDPNTYLCSHTNNPDVQFSSFASLESSGLSDFPSSTYLGTPYDSFTSSTSTDFSSFDSSPGSELHGDTPMTPHNQFGGPILSSTPDIKYTPSSIRSSRVDQSSFASLGSDDSIVLPSDSGRKALRQAQKKNRRKVRRNHGRANTFMTTNGIEIEDQSSPSKASRQKYPCDTCERSFARNEHLKRHKNSKCCYDKETKEQTKNYECALHCLISGNKPLCVKKFNNRRDNRQQHHVTHLGCKTGKSKTSPGVSPKMLRRMLYIQERMATNEDGEPMHDHAAAVKTVEQVHRHLLNKLRAREIALCKPEAAADEMIRQYTEAHPFRDEYAEFDDWDYQLSEFFNARF